MQSFLDLTMGGESKYLEFKQDYTASMLKTVSAYANEHDGRIMFGISDQGQLHGVNDPHQLRLKIENAINDNIQPRPFFEIEVQQVEEREILILKVYRGDNTPYYYHNKAFVRSDTASVEADRYKLNQLILAGQNIHFDETASIKQDLTFDVLERYLRQRLNIGKINKDILKSLDLIRKERFTNAAALLSDQNPVENAGMALIVFDSHQLNITDRNVLENHSVLLQFEVSLNFLKKHTNVSEKINGAFRQTIEEIPLIAYREAIANAIVHRDYQLRGQIKVEFFADRVEITSPGSLPEGISKDEYLAGRFSIPRNRILADIFLRLGIIEKLATGIRRIKECYQERDQQPSFIIYENSITVILPKSTMQTSHVVPESLFTPKLSVSETKILSLLNDKTSISRKEVSELFSIGKTRAYQLINGLVDKHLIYPVDSGKNTRYKLNR